MTQQSIQSRFHSSCRRGCPKTSFSAYNIYANPACVGQGRSHRARRLLSRFYLFVVCSHATLNRTHSHLTYSYKSLRTEYSFDFEDARLIWYKYVSIVSGWFALNAHHRPHHHRRLMGNQKNRCLCVIRCVSFSLHTKVIYVYNKKELHWCSYSRVILSAASFPTSGKRTQPAQRIEWVEWSTIWLSMIFDWRNRFVMYF